MIQGIIAFLKALPELLGLLKEINKFFKDAFGDSAKKKVKDTGHAFKKLNQAKSEKEKDDAVREIQKILNRL